MKVIGKAGSASVRNPKNEQPIFGSAVWFGQGIGREGGLALCTYTI
jgi:hypothetical protein